MSANIRKLEAVLGVELFDRKGKHLELNDYGTFLLKNIEPLINQMNDVFSILRNMQYANVNKVVIDAEPLFTFSGIFDRLYAQSNVYSGITIKNVRNPLPEVVSKIR